jgi:hypothetical protein
MISIKLKAKREVLLPTQIIPFKNMNYLNGIYQDRGQGAIVKVLLEHENIMRASREREEHIRAANRDLKYKIGDKVKLAPGLRGEVDDYDQDTEFEVVSFITQYANYPYFLEWPKHNNPFIVRVSYKSKKKGLNFLWCTNTFMVKKDDVNEDKKD